MKAALFKTGRYYSDGVTVRRVESHNKLGVTYIPFEDGNQHSNARPRLTSLKAFLAWAKGEVKWDDEDGWSFI